LQIRRGSKISRLPEYSAELLPTKVFAPKEDDSRGGGEGNAKATKKPKEKNYENLYLGGGRMGWKEKKPQERKGENPEN